MELNSNKFSTSQAFVNSGQNQVSPDKIPDAQIKEEDFERENRVENNASSLSHELKMLKGNAFGSPDPVKNSKLVNLQTLSPGSNFSRKFGDSIGKSSVNNNEVDDLIKWAKDLPDDISVNAGQSFY